MTRDFFISLTSAGIEMLFLRPTTATLIIEIEHQGIIFPFEFDLNAVECAEKIFINRECTARELWPSSCTFWASGQNSCFVNSFFSLDVTPKGAFLELKETRRTRGNTEVVEVIFIPTADASFDVCAKGKFASSCTSVSVKVEPCPQNWDVRFFNCPRAVPSGERWDCFFFIFPPSCTAKDTSISLVFSVSGPEKSFNLFWKGGFYLSELGREGADIGNIKMVDDLIFQVSITPDAPGEWFVLGLVTPYVKGIKFPSATTVKSFQSVDCERPPQISVTQSDEVKLGNTVQFIVDLYDPDSDFPCYRKDPLSWDVTIDIAPFSGEAILVKLPKQFYFTPLTIGIWRLKITATDGKNTSTQLLEFLVEN